MTRTRQELLLDIMEHLNLCGRSAADLITQYQDAGEEGLALAFMGLHRRVRSLCDTTFAVYEDETRTNVTAAPRDLESPADDYTQESP